MKNLSLFAASAVAASLAFASASSAATYISPWQFMAGGAIAAGFGDIGVGSPDTGSTCYNFPGPPAHNAGCATHDFDVGPVGGYDGSFTDTFSFLLPTGLINGGVISISIGNGSDLAFTSIDFNGVAGTIFNSQGFATATFAPQAILGGGPQVLTISGNGDLNAVYNGNASFVAGAVPEPMTWSLMVLGFAAMGGALRSRRRSASFA